LVSACAQNTEDTLTTLDYKVKSEVFVEDLTQPWGIDFIDAETALITDLSGTLHVVENGELRSEPVAGTPEVVYAGQGGLMDVAIDPNYEENGWIYLSFSHELESEGSGRAPAMTKVVRGHLENNRWVDQQVVFEAPHDLYRSTRHHYGSRIVFDEEGLLYFSIGDRGAMNQAQQLDRPNGKIHRIHRDGRIPGDNPFVDRDNAIKSIFTYGNRNPQGLAVHPETNEVWSVEHGPRGGDELNLIKAGSNYGWPEICYCINYDGSILTEDRTKEGMKQPILYWRPSIAVGGSDFYTGDLFENWKNYLLVTALKYQEVRLVNIKENRVLHQEVIVKNKGRVREAVTGPEGAIYVVLNGPSRILKLTPIEKRWQ